MESEGLEKIYAKCPSVREKVSKFGEVFVLSFLFGTFVEKAFLFRCKS